MDFQNEISILRTEIEKIKENWLLSDGDKDKLIHVANERIKTLEDLAEALRQTEQFQKTIDDDVFCHYIEQGFSYDEVRGAYMDAFLWFVNHGVYEHMNKTLLT